MSSVPSELPNSMHIFILKTDLFGVDKLLNESIAYLEAEHEVERFDATRPDLEDKDWDEALKKLVGADRVVSI